MPEAPKKTYAADVRPLFRDGDIKCMAKMHILLDNSAFMCDPAAGHEFADHGNARLVWSRLSDKDDPMPPDGPWSDDKLATYQKWMTDGFNP